MPTEPISIGSDRQLFFDDALTEQLDGVFLKQHEPVRRNMILKFDRSWEGETSWCPVVFKDDDKFRIWYRSQDAQQGGGVFSHSFTAYAESDDGIYWERPSLNLVEFQGSTANNICFEEPNTKNVAVFIDDRPGVPDSERYKCAGRWSGGNPGRIYSQVSHDGINWVANEEPLMVAPDHDTAFDSPISAFWDKSKGEYVLYARGRLSDGKESRIRTIRRTTSPDFVHWNPWTYIRINGKERYPHHLYTNAGHPYEFAPIYLMFPKRFIPERKFSPDWGHDGLSDVLFLVSRDGLNFSQPSSEAFMRPGLDPNNWHDRTVFIGPRVVQTGPGELSLYSVQNYRTESAHIRRFTIRRDGFTSIHAGGESGRLLTKPCIFEGNSLSINYSTSAVGSIRIGLVGEDGKPVPGRSLNDCPEIFGDEISRLVRWNEDGDLGQFAGKSVQLAIELKEADLYSFRFGSEAQLAEDC